MKIVVVSDTHGSTDTIIKNIRSMERPDMIFHLGDYIEDGIKIRDALDIHTIMVRGNGDFGKRKFEDEQIIEIMGRRIFLTHGHKYNVRFGVQNLFYRAMEVQADVVLYGHTHIAKILDNEGILIMNPGSPDYPRGITRKGTFGLITLGDKVKPKILEIKCV